MASFKLLVICLLSSFALALGAQFSGSWVGYYATKTYQTVFMDCSLSFRSDGTVLGKSRGNTAWSGVYDATTVNFTNTNSDGSLSNYFGMFLDSAVIKGFYNFPTQGSSGPFIILNVGYTPYCEVYKADTCTKCQVDYKVDSLKNCIEKDRAAVYAVSAAKTINQYSNNDVIAIVSDLDGRIVSAVATTSLPPGVTLSSTGSFYVVDNQKLLEGTYVVSVSSTDAAGGITNQNVTIVFLPILCGRDLAACGYACYEPQTFDCIYGKLCPSRLSLCGAETCYNSTVFTCYSNQYLCQVNNQICGYACYDPLVYKCCDPSTATYTQKSHDC